MKRHWVRALLVTSAVAWAVIALPLLGPMLVEAISAPDKYTKQFGPAMNWFWAGVIISGCASLFYSFIAGIPALMLADRLRLWRWWHALIVGGLAGAAVGLSWVLPDAVLGREWQWGPAIPALAIVGAISGLAGASVLGRRPKP